MNSGTLLVIPDIHGEIEKLEAILAQAGDDRIVFLGDYIDRGKNSAAVVRRVRTLTDEGHVALMGNHEEMLLDYIHGGGQTWFVEHIGGLNTLLAFSAEADRGLGTPGALHDYLRQDGLLEWIENLPRKVSLGGITFSHGPIAPGDSNANPTGNRPIQHNENSWSQELGEPGRGFVVCGHVPTLLDEEREGLSISEPGPDGPVVEFLCSDPNSQFDRKPMLFPHGLYLDCGCGCEQGAPLYAARLRC